MKHTQTTRCKANRHPEVRLSYEPDGIPDADVRWLLDHIQAMVAHGEVLRVGETIRIGWVDLEVGRVEKGMLQLLEPDWSGVIPSTYVPWVTETLRQLRRQRDAVDSLGLIDEILFPNICESGLVCSRLNLGEMGVMERLAPEGADSGWFVGCADASHAHDEPAELERVSLYQAAWWIPASVQFYALPAGCRVDVVEGLRVSRAGKEIRVTPGSYLERLRLRSSDA